MILDLAWTLEVKHWLISFILQMAFVWPVLHVCVFLI